MSATHDDYIRLIKERLSAAREIDFTADDYMYQIENIYGEVYSNNIRKFYHRVRKEFPDMETQKLTKLIQNNSEVWDQVLQEQMNSFSSFTENLFKVPTNILFEKNKETHDKVQEYSVKEDYKLDNEIAESMKNIEKKRAYLNLLKVQAMKLEEYKKACFDQN